MLEQDCVNFWICRVLDDSLVLGFIRVLLGSRFYVSIRILTYSVCTSVMAVSAMPTVPTRFLILSDTHNFDIHDTTLNNHPILASLPAADVVLHCGDLTHCGGTSSYKKAIKLLASIDAKLKLVIAGNHDLELDQGFWKTHLDEGDEPEDHDEALEVMRGKLAQEAGVVYLDEGTHSFRLENGPRLSIYVSPYTPAFNDWAFAYEHDQDRFNKPQDVLDGTVSIAENPIPGVGEVDVVMTSRAAQRYSGSLFPRTCRLFQPVSGD